MGRAVIDIGGHVGENLQLLDRSLNRAKRNSFGG